MAYAAWGLPVITGANYQDVQAWYNNLLDFIEFKLIADDKKTRILQTAVK